eukprot:3767809-Pleurochrysis_carterae.AAC.1
MARPHGAACPCLVPSCALRPAGTDAVIACPNACSQSPSAPQSPLACAAARLAAGPVSRTFPKAPDTTLHSLHSLSRNRVSLTWWSRRR